MKSRVNRVSRRPFGLVIIIILGLVLAPHAVCSEKAGAVQVVPDQERARIAQRLPINLGIVI